MPTPASIAAAKTESISEHFQEIGKTADGSEMPRWTGDKALKAQGETAWEYHVASALLRAAEKRRNDAVKAAIKAGVLFDHKESPLPAGSSRVVYAGPIVEIVVKVADGGKVGVNHDAYVEDLIKAGIDQKLLARLAKKHRTETAPSHTFTSSLVMR